MGAWVVVVIAGIRIQQVSSHQPVHTQARGVQVNEGQRPAVAEIMDRPVEAQSERGSLRLRCSDLATQVGDIFFAIQFADLRALLVESKAASADQIEALIQRDAICAFELFAQEE